MSSKNTSPLLSVRPRSVLASRPLLLRGEGLVLTPGASQSTIGLRIAVGGLPGVVACSCPDTIRCEAAQANRWLKCQPSSYVRLEAYGFFGVSLAKFQDSIGVGTTRR